MNCDNQRGSDPAARLREEQSLREQIAELEVFNRTVEDFGALLSHDLAGALRQISGFAELLRVIPTINGDPHTLAFLHTILSSARKLQEAVDKYLTPRPGASSPSDS